MGQAEADLLAKLQSLDSERSRNANRILAAPARHDLEEQGALLCR
eukprot:COSAG04_NODE_28631_length_274_cov_0.885714_1_plen_45_part_00